MKNLFKKMTCLFAFSVLVVIISVALKTKIASAACNHDWASATCSAPKTCKKYGCFVTEGNALGHNWSAATCTSPQKCTRCNVTAGAALGHSAGAAATCTSAQTCTRCKTQLKAALGHDWSAVTCFAPKTCKRYGCHATTGSAAGHSAGAAATCTSAQKCTKCGAQIKAALGHNWKDATCTDPKTCTRCEDTSGTALGHKSGAAATCTTAQKCTRCKTQIKAKLGHDWDAATCFAPKTCKRYGCNATTGSAKGHSAGAAATCTSAQKCTKCETVIEKKLGHSWKDATCTDPKTCTRCDKTSGTALGHKPGAAATCTTAQKCTRCHTQIKAKLGHDWDAATCFAPKTCKRYGCNATTGSAKGHSAGAAATCTSAQKCTKCETVIEKKLGHSWKDATCTDPKICTRCDKTSGTALGHSAGAAATCTTAQKCTRCYTQIKAKLGHDWDAATCFAPKTCKRYGCNATTGEPLGHDYAEATCTKDSECKKCGFVDKGSALGHKPGAEATCASPQKCTRSGCGAVIEEALGHKPGAAATCTDAQKCSRCKTVIKAALGHNWDAASCFAAATCKRTGCHQTTGESLGHSYKTGSTKCERCGYEKQEAKTVKVSFDINGGSDGGYITGITAKFGEKYGSLPAGPSPMKGYSKFLGWYTAKTGGTRVTSDTIVGFNYDHTLYAHYEANKYTIAFDGNGSTSGSMSSISARYDTGVTLPANKFAKSDYVFAGWNTSKDGTGKKYADKQSVKNLTDMNDGTVTLYAQWAKGYTITFDENGGYGGPGSQIGYVGSSVKLSTIEPKRDGYTFLGWSLDMNGINAEYVSGAKFPSNEDSDSINHYVISNERGITLYAIWATNTEHIVTFVHNDGTNGTTKKTKLLNEKVTGPILSKDGYVFLGWSKNENSSKATYKPAEGIEVTGDMTLYGVWGKIKEFTLTFDYNDGSGETKENVVEDGTEVQALWPSRTGYKFMGWSRFSGTNAQAEYEPNEQITVKKDLTLYAIWKKEVTITLVYNDGNNGTETIPSYTGGNVTMPGPRKVMDGYSLIGWSKSPEQEASIDYEIGETVQFIGDITLYAKWVQKRVVNYDLNGGDSKVTIKPQVIGFEEEIRLTTVVPERRFHVFLGWAIDTLPGATLYKPGASFPDENDAFYDQYNMDGGNITLYAIWQKIADGEMITGLQNTYGKSNLPDEIFLKEYESTEWIKLSSDAYAVVKTSKDEFGGVDFYYSSVFVIEKKKTEIEFNMCGSNMGLSTAFELHILEEHSDWLGVTIVSAGRILKEAINNATDTAVTVLFPAGEVILLTRDFISMVDDFHSLYEKVKESYEEIENKISEEEQIEVDSYILSYKAWEMMCEIQENDVFAEVFEEADDAAEELFSMDISIDLVRDLIEFWTLMGRSCYENVDPNGGLDEVAGYYIELLKDAGFSQSVTSNVGSVLTNLYNVTVAPVESV